MQTMTNNTINEIFDDKKILGIKQADWFKTMEHYPKTVGQMKLLVSIIDKIGIMTNFDLSETVIMDANKLNILYAVLRIMNKVFNGYLDFVVKKIFCDGLKEIFVCSHLTCYDLFFDQLTQDIDHFVCLTICKNNTAVVSMDTNETKNKFTDYLRSTFGKTFYQKMMKKLMYHVDDNFYLDNEKLFETMVDEFIKYTNETLTETYETMKLFLEKIFSKNCTNECTFEIINALKKHIDLENLFGENCMELDIYVEQKLDNESGFDDVSFLDKINNTIYHVGYQLYQNNKEDEPMSILQPFVDHNLVANKNDIVILILAIFTNYKKIPYIIDKNNANTLEDYYILSMADDNLPYVSYENFCKHIMKTNTLPNNSPEEMILRLLSRVFNCRLEILNPDLSITEIDNTLNHCDNAITIYKYDNNAYYTIQNLDMPFSPVAESPITLATLVSSFKKKHTKKSKKYQSQQQIAIV